MKGIGADFVRVPRSINPYAAARRLARLAHGSREELAMLHTLAQYTRRSIEPSPIPPSPSPDVDTNAPCDLTAF